MEANSRQDAYQSLVSLAEKQGYVTFDNIMDCADDYSLSIQDFDWLSNAITTRGILVYSENPNLQSTDDTEYDDYAQSDYEAVYSRIIELCPSMENFVTKVRNILPPQYGEISRLKYQILDGNLHARSRMIEMHLRIALRIALARAEMYDVGVEDVVGDACIGLVYAVDKYDPDTSGPFSSYASLWILQNISRVQENQRPLVYYPVHRKEKYFNAFPYIKARGCIGCEEAISCLDLREFVVEKVGYSSAEAEYVISQMIPLNSLQELIEYEERRDELEEKQDTLIVSLHSLAFDKEDEMLMEVYKAQRLEIVEKTLDTLRPREAEVIRLRYGFYGREMTLEEVGQRIGVTRERIRQIEAKALRKLRRRRLKNKLLN